MKEKDERVIESTRAKDKVMRKLKTKDEESLKLKIENLQLKFHHDHLVHCSANRVESKADDIRDLKLKNFRLKREASEFRRPADIIKDEATTQNEAIVSLKTKKWAWKTRYENLAAGLGSHSIEAANVGSDSRSGRLRSAPI